MFEILFNLSGIMLYSTSIAMASTISFLKIVDRRPPSIVVFEAACNTRCWLKSKMNRVRIR
jgi:hypothetical protein